MKKASPIAAVLASIGVFVPMCFVADENILNPDRETDAVRTENGKWTAVRTAGESVAVVFDAGSAADAAARLDAVEERLKEEER